jgi:hypothetical protein
MEENEDLTPPTGEGMVASITEASLRLQVTTPQSKIRRREMGRNYGAPRLWSSVLIVVGIVGVVLVVIGTIVAMVEAVTFGQALTILLIGEPLAALLACWHIALGQGLRALADVAEYGGGGRGTWPAGRPLRAWGRDLL